MKKTLDAAVSLALAAGFAALAAWSVAHGIAGAKYGAAERAASPGTFWFFIGGQVFLAAAFAGRGAQAFYPALKLKRGVVGGLAVIILLGVWMGIERARDFVAIVKATPDLGEKLAYAGLALACLGAFGAVFYQLVWLELKDQLKD